MLGTGIMRLFGSVIGINEDNVVGNDTGGHPLGAVLIGDFAVADPALDDRPLALTQELHDRVA